MAPYVMGSSFLTLNPSNVIGGAFPKKRERIGGDSPLGGSWKAKLGSSGILLAAAVGD
jgi:hypothetical protein